MFAIVGVFCSIPKDRIWNGIYTQKLIFLRICISFRKAERIFTKMEYWAKFSHIIIMFLLENGVINFKFTQRFAINVKIANSISCWPVRFYFADKFRILYKMLMNSHNKTKKKYFQNFKYKLWFKQSSFFSALIKKKYLRVKYII